MPRDANDPTPAEHWGTKNPEEQPAYSEVAGLGRLVVLTRDRLGPNATPEAVLAELRAAGVDADPDEVKRWLNPPG
jgi:hypothetical protein